MLQVTSYFLDLPVRHIALAIATTDVVAAGIIFFVAPMWLIRHQKGEMGRLSMSMLIAAVLMPYLDYLFLAEATFDLAHYHGSKDIIYTVVLVPLLLPIILAWPAMAIGAIALLLAYELQSRQLRSIPRRFTGSSVLLLSLASIAMSSLAEAVWLAQ